MQWPPTCGGSGTRMGMGGNSPACDCSAGSGQPPGHGERSIAAQAGKGWPSAAWALWCFRSSPDVSKLAVVDEQFRSCEAARIVGRKKRHSRGDLLYELTFYGLRPASKAVVGGLRVARMLSRSPRSPVDNGFPPKRLANACANSGLAEQSTTSRDGRGSGEP
jgi:hypothetical protein